MEKAVMLVVGAAGDVGRGIVAAGLESGRKVVAAGRTSASLAALAQECGSERLATVQGDIGDEAQAVRLWDAAAAPFGRVTDVVLSVNAPYHPRTLEHASLDAVSSVIAGNLLTHLIAARIMLPRMLETGVFLGIGGGTADFIFPGMAPVSMSQAALRMLYRGLAKERAAGPQVRELIIASMVAGRSNRGIAKSDWVTDLEVGLHVTAILAAPERFPKPILYLRSRAHLGQPEPDA